ncbi:hypothetical protein COV18_07175 [Candidatus Woesearchaeota archaeon CG10_big_fil_rev_8_21_14_0_10_37_12]|nr:MAG: hypothetical protein COV18_07175 [Candidatus Woesearchaeota archaeon CG10_big_fil_rev_8_21_14_0_10_37_12]
MIAQAYSLDQLANVVESAFRGILRCPDSPHDHVKHKSLWLDISSRDLSGEYLVKDYTNQNNPRLRGFKSSKRDFYVGRARQQGMQQKLCAAVQPLGKIVTAKIPETPGFFGAKGHSFEVHLCDYQAMERIIAGLDPATQFDGLPDAAKLAAILQLQIATLQQTKTPYELEYQPCHPAGCDYSGRTMETLTIRLRAFTEG